MAKVVALIISHWLMFIDVIDSYHFELLNLNHSTFMSKESFLFDCSIYKNN